MKNSLTEHLPGSASLSPQEAREIGLRYFAGDNLGHEELRAPVPTASGAVDERAALYRLFDALAYGQMAAS